MAYRMKGFSGFGNSPAKQYAKESGPRAEKKKESIEEQKVKARMHNTMEIKEQALNLPPYYEEVPADPASIDKRSKWVRRGRRPQPLEVEPFNPKPLTSKSPAKISDNKLVNLQAELDHTQLDYRKPGWAGAAEKVGETLEAKGVMDGGGGKDKKGKKKKSEKRVIGPDDKSNPWWSKFENDSNNSNYWEAWEKRKHDMF